MHFRKPRALNSQYFVYSKMCDLLCYVLKVLSDKENAYGLMPIMAKLSACRYYFFRNSGDVALVVFTTDQNSLAVLDGYPPWLMFISFLPLLVFRLALQRLPLLFFPR
jgi:hypothetical protein